MALSKIRKERFSRGLTLKETREIVRDNYICRIERLLDGYTRRLPDIFPERYNYKFIGEIPSIPGGRLTVEQERDASKDEARNTTKISLELEYLEDAPAEDVEKLRGFCKVACEKGYALTYKDIKEFLVRE